MKKWLFIIVVVGMYAVLPFCAYEAWYISVNEADQMKSESIVMGNAPTTEQLEAYEMQQAGKSSLDSEKMGFMCAAAVCFIMPSLMIAFRRRLIQD